MEQQEQGFTKVAVMKYLDDLRASGATNMFGASPYIQRQFGVTEEQARRLLAEWMRTYGERHADDE